MTYTAILPGTVCYALCGVFRVLSSRNFKFLELVVTILLLSLGVFLLYLYNIARFPVLQGDSAGFVDLLRSVAQGQGMVSPTFASAYSLVHLPSLTQSSAYCSTNLHSISHSLSFLNYHPYLIVYLLSPLISILKFPPGIIAAAINAINLVGGLGLIYWYLRSRRLPIILALLFMLAVAIFPWWIGDLNGQYYYDRLFFLPGLALIFLMMGAWGNGKGWIYKVCILFILSILISERPAMILSAIALGYWVIYGRCSLKNKDVVWLILGLLGLIYFVVWLKFFQNYQATYGAISFNSIIVNLKSSLLPGGALHPQTLQWMVVLMPFFFLAMLNFKRAIFVIIVLMPNLMLTMGGAEKTGFYTHYHSIYFPILIAIAAINFADLLGHKYFMLVTHLFYRKMILYVVACGLIFYGACLNINNPENFFSLTNIQKLGLNYEGIIPWSPVREALRVKADFFTMIVSQIPKTASVSAPEGIQPVLVLHGNLIVDYMPIGIGSSEYVVAPYNVAKNRLVLPSYSVSNAYLNAISRCIQAKLTQKYSKVLSKNYLGNRFELYRRRVIQ